MRGHARDRPGRRAASAENLRRFVALRSPALEDGSVVSVTLISAVSPAASAGTSTS